jgi:hypothetical protein
VHRIGQGTVARLRESGAAGRLGKTHCGHGQAIRCPPARGVDCNGDVGVYEYRLTEVRHEAKAKRGTVWRVSIAGVNQGVAPFYYPWPVLAALVTEDAQVAQTMDLPDDIRQHA